MPKTPSPVTLRLDAEHQKLLTAMSLDGVTTPSDVLRQGLRILAASRKPGGAPLYPILVDSAAVQEVVDEAVRAACDVLSSLFPEAPRETAGISSNFQGTLIEHISAMLQGKEGAPHRGYRRELSALLGDEHAFGRLPPVAGEKELQSVYTVACLPKRAGDPTLFFDGASQRFVPLQKLAADELFTSQRFAIEATFKHFAAQDLSPRAADYRMCRINVSGEELTLEALAFELSRP